LSSRTGEKSPESKSADMDMEEVGAQLAQRKDELMSKAGKYDPSPLRRSVRW